MGGDTPPTPTPTPKPCATLTKDGQNQQVKTQLNALEALLHDDKEHAYTVQYDAAANPRFTQYAGESGAAGIDLSIKGTISSFTHTHYDGLLSIFSGADLRTVATLYTGHHLADPSTFTMQVVTASGTFYSLSISDQTAFKAFCAQYFSDVNSANIFELSYASLYRIDPSKTVDQNETAFLQMLVQAKAGLTSYKGDPANPASWGKMSYDDAANTKFTAPCE